MSDHSPATWQRKASFTLAFLLGLAFGSGFIWELAQTLLTLLIPFVALLIVYRLILGRLRR